jgi:WD40 repeat protein
MWTNLIGNRSYVDINQYPVFPWIIQDYLSDKIELTEEYLRNLKLPIGMVVPPNNKERATQRINSFIEIYNIMINELRQELELEIEEENETTTNQDERKKTQTTEEIKKPSKDEQVFAQINKGKNKIDFESIPYFFGSHYSNALYINHYLMRLFPYASALIELQGNKFDDPQRLFHNLHLTFSSATGQKSDVRELCPEFFYFNQMFININNFNFGKAIDITTSSEGAQYTIGNVQLPKWAEDNACKFIEKQRTILEETSAKDIHEWIDLIFGSKQTGYKARKHRNLYIPYSYEGTIKLEEYKDKKLQMHLRLAEMGLTPIKVYYNEVKERGKPTLKADIFKEKKIKRIGKTISFTVPKELKGNNTYNKDKLIPVYYAQDNNDIDNCRCLYAVFSDLSRGKIYLVANTLDDLHVNATISYKSPLYNNNNAHFLQKLASCHNNTNVYPHAYALYNKGDILVVGGFWDGSLIMVTKENKIEYILNPSYSHLHNKDSYSHLKPTNILQIHPSPITFICMNNNNTAAYCGTANGHIFQFSIQNKTQWTFTQTQHAHEASIKYITLNTNLQMLASIGADNYVFIYTLPSLRITSSLRFDYASYIPDYVFLSSSPVPCVVLYSLTNNEFKVYDINGNYMTSLKDEHTNMISPVVYTSNINFKDYLVYINDKAETIVKSFPFMTNENANAIRAKKVRKGRFMCLQKDGKGIIVVGNDLSISLITNYDDLYV